MTGPLNSLLNRALGRGSNRLKPRTPSLFEPQNTIGTTPESVHEVSSETARQTQSPENAVARTDAETQARPRGRPGSNPSLHAPLPEEVTSDPGPLPNHVRGAKEIYQEPSNPFEQQRSAPTPKREPARGVTSRMPEVPMEPDSILGQSPPVWSQISEVFAPEPNGPTHHGLAPSASDPARAPEHTDNKPRTFADGFGTTRTATPAPPEPDIHIHIGRLEVRSTSPKSTTRPHPSAPRKRASKGKSLSDYLKDRGR